VIPRECAAIQKCFYSNSQHCKAQARARPQRNLKTIKNPSNILNFALFLTTSRIKQSRSDKIRMTAFIHNTTRKPLCDRKFLCYPNRKNQYSTNTIY
jgi:hypothetical protein